jgi:hypothetical protein
VTSLAWFLVGGLSALLVRLAVLRWVRRARGIVATAAFSFCGAVLAGGWSLAGRPVRVVPGAKLEAWDVLLNQAVAAIRDFAGF